MHVPACVRVVLLKEFRSYADVRDCVRVCACVCVCVCIFDTKLSQIRKVCNHLFLIGGARDTVERDNANKGNNMLLASSSKLVFLDKLLEKLRAERKKVVRLCK